MTDHRPGQWYEVRYIRDRVNKMWHAEIPKAPEIRIAAHSLDKVEEHARNALAASLNVPASDLHLRHDYHLGGDAEEAVMTSIEARRIVNEASNQAAQRTAEAARKLTEGLGLNLRDTARILQLSHQRVSQILVEETLHSNAVEVRSRLDGRL